MMSKTDEMKKEKDILSNELKLESAKIDEMVAERGDLESRIDKLEKENNKYQKQVTDLQQNVECLKEEKEEKDKQLKQEKEKQETYAKTYIEDLRKELAESKAKVDSMVLESEALKSENEALFRANESRKEEKDELQRTLDEMKKQLNTEKLRYQQLQKDWEIDKSKTEFVMVSKASKVKSRMSLHTFKEGDDSEEEHVVSVAEAARAESEALREKERDLLRKIKELNTDKQELFRSGTNLFAENKSLSNRNDSLMSERNELLRSDDALKRKVREQEEEIRKLKKTVDDMYYQNVAIRSNEEHETKKDAYVALIGNDMIKELEREKSALYRRTQFLEKENREIEARVIELEKQSDKLLKYSKKYDKYSDFPEPSRRDSLHSETYANDDRGAPNTQRISEQDRDRIRKIQIEVAARKVSHPPRHEYQQVDRPPPHRIRTPEYYRKDAPPFGQPPSRQPSFGQDSIHSVYSRASHDSRFSLPPISNRSDIQRPRSKTSPVDRGSRRVTPLNARR